MQIKRLKRCRVWKSLVVKALKKLWPKDGVVYNSEKNAIYWWNIPENIEGLWLFSTLIF